MSTLILPVAGMSSRFPGVRPKWLLVHPNGNLMIAEAVAGLELGGYDRVCIITIQDHVDEYNFIEGVTAQFTRIPECPAVEVIVLDAPTNSQPETVAMGIRAANIEGQIYIKDSDNYFKESCSEGNFVSTFDLNDMSLVHAKNKSYVVVNDSGEIADIVEKRVVSSTFNVGGYGFKDAREFLRVYDELSGSEGLYVSHIIYRMILDGTVFNSSSVEGYQDWGTLKEWNMYKSEYVTLFVDVDGTLMKNSGEFFEPIWGTTEKIVENVNTINRLYDSGKVKVILTTSRKSAFKIATEKQLEKEGVSYHEIIFDLYHGKRIIINDYAPTNPYKSCDAINIKRNSEDLRELLDESLGFDVV